MPDKLISISKTALGTARFCFLFETSMQSSLINFGTRCLPRSFPDFYAVSRVVRCRADQCGLLMASVFSKHVPIVLNFCRFDDRQGTFLQWRHLWNWKTSTPISANRAKPETWSTPTTRSFTPPWGWSTKPVNGRESPKKSSAIKTDRFLMQSVKP